jgi:hypothetical protein
VFKILGRGGEFGFEFLGKDDVRFFLLRYFCTGLCVSLSGRDLEVMALLYHVPLIENVPSHAPHVTVQSVSYRHYLAEQACVSRQATAVRLVKSAAACACY